MLSVFFKAVTTAHATRSHYRSVKIKDIFGKPVIIQTADYTFLVDQPNIWERH